jgi:hypothetical protein
MHCPKCKQEYRTGYDICPDCKEPLLEQVTIDIEKIEAMDPVKLTSVATEVEAQVLMNLLLHNQISCFKKSKGMGGYMNLYMGYSVYGEDIFVDKADYSLAMEILDSLSDNEDYVIESEYEKEIEQESEQETEQGNGSIPFYRKPQIVARIILVLMVGSVILSYIINNYL